MDKLPIIKRDVIVTDEFSQFTKEVRRFGYNLQAPMLKIVTENECNALQNAFSQHPNAIKAILEFVDEQEDIHTPVSVVAVKAGKKSRSFIDLQLAPYAQISLDRKGAVGAIKQAINAEKLPKAFVPLETKIRVGTHENKIPNTSVVQQSLHAIFPKIVELGPLSY